MSETIFFDYQFYYVLNNPKRHSMDAMVFNSFEKQIISSFCGLHREFARCGRWIDDYAGGE